MPQFAIRCQRCAPSDTDDLADWFSKQTETLRALTTTGTVRVSRLVEAGPEHEVDTGWLVEADVPAVDERPTLAFVNQLLRDMRLMGLQPTLLSAAR